MGMRLTRGFHHFSWMVISLALMLGQARAETLAVPSPVDALSKVQRIKGAAYRDLLLGYDAAAKAQPHVAEIAVSRCGFIAQFIDDEYGEWVESAADEYEQCQQQLKDQFPKSPEAQLFLLRQLWGEEAVKAGEALVTPSSAWPDSMRRALFAHLSQVYESLGNASRAGEYAVKSARLGEYELAAPAIQHLVKTGNVQAAVNMLKATPPASDSWHAKERIEAAMVIPERRWAAWELNRYANADFEIDVSVAGRAHLHTGESDVAHALMVRSKDSMDDTVRFDIALAKGDLGTAVGLLDILAFDEFPEQLRRFMMLITHAPSTMFSIQALLAALALAILLGALALLPGLVIVPAHYRGLMRFQKGLPARQPLFEAIGLRSAWMGMAVFICVPLLIAFFVAPVAIEAFLSGESLPKPTDLFRATLWGTVVALLSISIFALSMSRRELLGGTDTLKRLFWVPAIWIALILLFMMLNGPIGGLISGGGSGEERSMHVQQMESLASGGVQVAGTFITFLLMVVLVPILEELTFRGLLLGGLTRYLSFGWSNTIQAGLFAVIHDDPARLPFFFAFGWAAGWLAKKDRSLALPILLHMLNNTFAFSIMFFG